MQLCTIIHSATNEHALDFILAASALFETVVVIFIGEGAKEVIANKQYAVLPEYDITRIYIDSAALLETTNFMLPITKINHAEIKMILQQSQRIFHF